MSASQVGCKTIGCDIKSVDTGSKGGDSQYSVDGNSLSKISEDLTESCIFRLSNAMQRRYLRILALSWG